MSESEATLAHNAGINKLHYLNEMVINSIEDGSGMNCLDVTSRPDGQFTFKVFRNDPEDQGRWTLVGGYSKLQFDTEDQALR